MATFGKQVLTLNVEKLIGVTETDIEKCLALCDPGTLIKLEKTKAVAVGGGVFVVDSGNGRKKISSTKLAHRIKDIVDDVYAAKCFEEDEPKAAVETLPLIGEVKVDNSAEAEAIEAVGQLIGLFARNLINRKLNTRSLW